MQGGKAVRNKLWIIALVIVVLCTCSCTHGQGADGSDDTVQREVFAMDTVMIIRATGKTAQTAVDQAVAEINRLDALLSAGSGQSEIGMINLNGEGELSEDALFLVRRSLELYKSTEGAYDITVYPLMKLWGFAGGNAAVPEKDRIREVLSQCGSDKLRLDGNRLILGKFQSIDLGGIAKGYTSDRIMKIFEDNGVTSGMVSLGGNVACYRTKPDGSLWRCGITDPEKPDDSTSLLGIVSVRDKSVITSGGYERFFTDESGKKYHHIMDMKTGYPADSGLLSVTIISEDGTLADGLSTALFVMGEEKAVDFWRGSGYSFDFVMLTADGRLLVSEGIADSFESSTAQSLNSRFRIVR